MKKLGILVGEKGDWKFFNHIHDDLSTVYETVVHEPKDYSFPLLRGRLNRWAFTNQIEKVLKQSDIALFEWASELLVPASRMPKYCPIVTRLHSYELYTWAPLIDWNGVDKVIMVSKAMQAKFNALYPDHAYKTEVVYNAKPLDTFKPIPKREFDMNLGMLGSFNPRKRIYEIVMMVHALRQRGYNMKLHLAGGRLHGPDMDEYYVSIQRLIDKLNLHDSVIYYDHIDNVHEWLQKIDIYITNSYWEGHQVSLVEAMASGCYCFSHFWDGAEEVLPQENLYALETELMEKIIDYSELPDSEKRQKCESMRQIACERYDDRVQKAAFRRIVDEVLSKV